MKVYTVHMRRQGLAPERDIVLVKEGFSWLAFVFSVFWSLYYRLWLPALALVLAFVLLATIVELGMIDNIVSSVFEVGVCVLFGCWANDLRRNALGKNGFEELGVVVAANRDEAEQRHFDRNPGTIRMLES